jgi:ADP-ribose pyrophosphatase
LKRATVLERRRILDAFFKVDEAKVSYERYDGSMTPAVSRLVFERGDSAAAVVYHRDSGCVLLTEQFRFPTLDKGPGWITEVPAGMIAPGEQPDRAMRRELEEEIGYRVAAMRPIAMFYVSPGGSSERIWLYYAEVSDSARVSAGGGNPGETEDIRIVAVPLAEVADRLAQGEFADAKTIIGLQWLLRHAPGTGA